VGQVYDRIDDRLRAWIARQPMFFVGTAPSGEAGHVNISPKGPIGTLRVLDDRTLAYLDVIGSGAETIAHLRENGRIVVMLCAFDGPPKILRLHGRGDAVVPGDPLFEELLERAGFDVPAPDAARRAVIVVAVERIADSCGYGVPLMTYEGERPHLDAWVKKKLRVGGTEALMAYQEQHNSASIDGLPALDVR
jgi:predicted pyridoxine 5'-phosphate oxidase superfamily flavin-nucleotide-binding protein